MTALDQLTADARLAVELREEAETHRIEGSDDYFCGGRLMRAAADAIERLQNSSAPETSAPPIPEVLGKAWERIGYLEESLRHIREVAMRRRPSIVCVQVPELALSALQDGDPLTCPEARQVKTTKALSDGEPV